MENISCEKKLNVQKLYCLASLNLLKGCPNLNKEQVDVINQVILFISQWKDYNEN